MNVRATFQFRLIFQAFQGIATYLRQASSLSISSSQIFSLIDLVSPTPLTSHTALQSTRPRPSPTASLGRTVWMTLIRSWLKIPLVSQNSLEIVRRQTMTLRGDQTPAVTPRAVFFWVFFLGHLRWLGYSSCFVWYCTLCLGFFARGHVGVLRIFKRSALFPLYKNCLRSSSNDTCQFFFLELPWPMSWLLLTWLRLQLTMCCRMVEYPYFATEYVLEEDFDPADKFEQCEFPNCLVVSHI